MIAYAILMFFMICRLILKKRSRSAITRTGLMGFVLSVGIVIFFTSLKNGGKGSETIVFINISFLLVFIRRLREVWKQIAQVIVGSSAVFIIIFCFILFFSFLGYAIFQSNSYSHAFVDPFSALYTVFITFTVSNYPDVMIPYFAVNRLSAVYFWVFLCVAVMLLTNLLLAVIFNNYQHIL
jgi:hypothetical protein